MWHHHPPTLPTPSPTFTARLLPVICEQRLNGETAGTLQRGTAAPCSQSGAPGAIHHTPHPGLLWPETEGGWERRGETHPLSPAFAPRAANVLNPSNPHFHPPPPSPHPSRGLLNHSSALRFAEASYCLCPTCWVLLPERDTRSSEPTPGPLASLELRRLNPVSF